MKKNTVSTFKIAATYIGTIVGAGFATGQETLQFFAPFGVYGVWGIILASVLFIIFGFIIMNIGHKINADSHLDILDHTSGKILRFIMDGIVTFFLFGALTAMIAGTGALFAQQFGLPGILGNLVMAAITVLTALTGIKGIVNSISLIVPFMIATIVGVCLYSISTTPPDMTSGEIIAGSGLINNWLFSAILYVSYNTVLSVAVLGPLGAQAKSKKAILNGAILGGVGLGIGSVLIYLAISGNILNVKDMEIPMAYIAGNISFIIQIIFAIMLIAEVYTTAVGSLFGFTSRLFDTKKPAFKSKPTIIATTILAFFASLLGFTSLVKYLYPLVGYGGILLLICLLYSSIKSRFYRKSN